MNKKTQRGGKKKIRKNIKWKPYHEKINKAEISNKIIGDVVNNNRKH